MIRPSLTAITALLLAPTLASCSIFQSKETPPCPPVYILADAGNLTKYRPGNGRDLTDIAFEGEIRGYQGSCQYDEKGAKVDIQVSFALTRGPANSDRKAQFSYFVAIPHFFPSPEAKAEFPVSVDFPEGTNYMRYTDEEVSMRIPVKDKDVISKYEIYIGFQTSPEELEYNRQHKK